MPDFEISELDDEDLVGIAQYTVKTWDAEQALRYADYLDQHFTAIGKGEALTRMPFNNRPELQSSRCQKHVVFHLIRKNKCPLIIAVLHERMDLMTRLKDRLG